MTSMTPPLIELPGITLSEVDAQVFLRVQPSPGRVPVDVATLRTLLVQHGFGNYLLHEEAIAKAASECNTQTTPFLAALADRVDAKIEVKVAPDHMSAQISLQPAHGGKAAAMEDVLRALAGAGVVFGIDETALLRVCELGDCRGFAVAIGDLAKDGTDAYFEKLIAQSSVRAPKVDDKGLIDYREHGSVAVVHAGTPLMRRIPATPGEPGRTIMGQVLTPRGGVDKPFAHQLPGSQFAPNDHNVLQAALTGQPVLLPDGVMVEPILRVKDVDMASGNIHYDGTVEVQGDVVQEMKVQAKGDIVVGGVVEAGFLTAGGNIHVSGGVISHAVLKAKGSITARFAQGVSLSTDTVVVVKDMAMECTLESLNQILVGTEASERGRLVGGLTIAMLLIRVPNLGSDKAGITTVRLGHNPELEEQYKTLCERLDKEKATEENLQKIVKQLTATGDPKKLLDRVKASWRNAVQVWGKSLAEKTALEEQIALGKTAKLEVTKGVSGAVDLTIGNQTVKLRREFSAGVFSLDETGLIAFTSKYGGVEPLV